MTDKPCVFCAIVAGDAPAKIVDRSDDCLVIVPRDPVVPGHVLVIPRVHVADFMDDPAVTARVMMDAAGWAGSWAQPYEGADWPTAWNLITSAGSEATQTVFHLHVHLVPRRAGDRLLLPWSAQQASPEWRSDTGHSQVQLTQHGVYAHLHPGHREPTDAHAAGLALIAGAYRQQRGEVTS